MTYECEAARQPCASRHAGTFVLSLPSSQELLLSAFMKLSAGEQGLAWAKQGGCQQEPCPGRRAREQGLLAPAWLGTGRAGRLLPLLQAWHSSAQLCLSRGSLHAWRKPPRQLPRSQHQQRAVATCHRGPLCCRSRQNKIKAKKGHVVSDGQESLRL